MQSIETFLIPVLLLWLLGAAAWKRLPVYDLFIKGGKEGFHVAIGVLPNLAAMMVALSMLAASGLMDAIIRLFAPLLQGMGLPAEVAPLALLRPLSGSAALGMLEQLLAQYGADSRVGLIACTLMGSSETIFYTVCIYLGAVKQKSAGYAIPCAFLGSICAMMIAGWLFP